MPAKQSQDGETLAAAGARRDRDGGNHREDKKASDWRWRITPKGLAVLRELEKGKGEEHSPPAGKDTVTAKKASTSESMSLPPKLTLKNAQEFGDQRACVYKKARHEIDLPKLTPKNAQELGDLRAGVFKKARHETDEDQQERKDYKEKAIDTAKKARTSAWMSMLPKLTLKDAQELGDLWARVYGAWLAAYAAQGKKKRRRPNLGPSMVYIFAGLTRAMIGRGDDIGSRNLEKLKEGIKQEIKDALEYATMCRMKKTHFEGNGRLMFCIRSQKDLKRSLTAALDQMDGAARTA